MSSTTTLPVDGEGTETAVTSPLAPVEDNGMEPSRRTSNQETSTSNKYSNQPTYFAVRRGMNNLQNCIFLRWEDCQQHVNDSSQYASFDSLAKAELYLKAQSSPPKEPIATSTHPTGSTVDPSRTGHDSTIMLITAAAKLSSSSDTPHNGNASESMAKKRALDDLETSSSCNDEESSSNKRPKTAIIAATNTTAATTTIDPSAEAQWMKLYRMAIAYGKVHGHYDIPKESTNSVHVQLRQWMEHLQTHYKDILNGTGPDLVQKLLTKTRINKLIRLNFPFQPEMMTSSSASSSNSMSTKGRSDKKFSEEQWMKFFRLAIAYKKKHGTFDIPAADTTTTTNNPEQMELRQWMQWQRITYRHVVLEGKPPPARHKFLTEARIRELQKLGFSFDEKQSLSSAAIFTHEKLRKRKPHPNWMLMYHKLKDYYATHQTFIIPPLPNPNTTTTSPSSQQGAEPQEFTVSEEDKAREELRLWLKEQNNEYANLKEKQRSTMTADKIQLLAEIGYEFHYVTFAEHLEQLKAYIQEHGTREIPESHPLSKWAKKVKGQMRRLAEGKPGVKLSEAEAQQLQELGFFPGNIRTPVNQEEEDRKWEEMYEKMKEYKKEHGDCLISTTNWQDPLVKWTVTQRRHYKTIAKKGSCVHLDARKLQKLHEIGFVFKQVDGGYKSFAERLEELREFKAKHGHLRVPTNQPGTGGFVAYCRDQYRLAERGEKHSMTEEKFQVLREMGFEFQVGKANPRNYSHHTWEERFQQLLQYKEKYGSTVVPQHFTGFNNLGQWVKTQRDYYRSLRKGQKSPMTTEQALKLNDIGFVWDAQAYKRKKAAIDDKNEESDGDGEYEEGGGVRPASVVGVATHNNTTINNNNKIPDLREEGRKQGPDGESSSDDVAEAPPRFYDAYY